MKEFPFSSSERKALLVFSKRVPGRLGDPVPGIETKHPGLPSGMVHHFGATGVWTYLRWNFFLAAGTGLGSPFSSKPANEPGQKTPQQLMSRKTVGHDGLSFLNGPVLEAWEG